MNFGTPQRVFLVSVGVFGSASFRKERLDPLLTRQWPAVSIAALTSMGVKSVGSIFLPVDVVKSKATVPVRRWISGLVAPPAKAGATKIIDFWPVVASRHVNLPFTLGLGAHCRATRDKSAPERAPYLYRGLILAKPQPRS